MPKTITLRLYNTSVDTDGSNFRVMRNYKGDISGPENPVYESEFSKHKTIEDAIKAIREAWAQGAVERTGPPSFS